MGSFGRKRNGHRLTMLLFLLGAITQYGVFCVTADAPTPLDLLEEETTASSSIPENTGGRDQFNFRTTVSMTNQSRHRDNLSVEEVTKSNPLVKAQRLVTTKDSLSATLSHEVETTPSTSHTTTQPQRLENSTSPSKAVFMTTPPSATESSDSVPTKDNSIADALQDAAGTSTPTYTSSPLTNATTTAISSDRGLLSADKDGRLDITTNESASHSPQKATVTTAQSTMPTVEISDAPIGLPGSEILTVTTGRPQETVSNGRKDADISTSSETPTANSLAQGYQWYIVLAVLVLATLILIICFIWNVRRRRTTGSTSFQNTHKKKNKKGGEDAWAGPVQMPEENGVPVDVVDDDQDPSGKRLTLTTFFNKRKSRQSSVVLEEVTAQPGKPTKDEASPLLTPNANGQANGSANMPQDEQNISPTAKSNPTSGEQESPPPPEVQEPPPAQAANIEALLPPPSTPPETDFPAPPPSPEMQASQSTV